MSTLLFHTLYGLTDPFPSQTFINPTCCTVFPVTNFTLNSLNTNYTHNDLVSSPTRFLTFEPMRTRSILALSYVQEPNFIEQFW